MRRLRQWLIRKATGSGPNPTVNPRKLTHQVSRLLDLTGHWRQRKNSLDERSGSRFEVLFGMDQAEPSEVGVQNLKDFFNGISNRTPIPYRSPKKKIGVVVIGPDRRQAQSSRKFISPNRRRPKSPVNRLRKFKKHRFPLAHLILRWARRNLLLNKPKVGP